MKFVNENDKDAFKRVEVLVNKPLLDHEGQPIGSLHGDAVMGSTPVRNDGSTFLIIRIAALKG